METNPLVHLGDVMKKRVLVVSEERVWNPDLFGKVPGQRHVVLDIRRERQSLVLPVLVQIDRYRVVLKTKSTNSAFYPITIYGLQQ